MSTATEKMQKVDIAYPPRFTFPGDELVTPDGYRSVMRQGYVASFMIFEGVMNANGKGIPEDAAECTKRMTGAANVLDDVLDESDVPIDGYRKYRGIIGAMTTGTYTELEFSPDDPAVLQPNVLLLGNAIRSNFDERSTDRVAASAMVIAKASLKKRTISDPLEYQRVLAGEARATGRLVASAVLNSNIQKPSQREVKDITRFVTGFMTLKTMHDSAHDLQEDRDNRLTLVEPTNHARSILLARAGLELFMLKTHTASRHYLRTIRDSQFEMPTVLL